MRYRVLGRSGLKVAPLALGTGHFGGPTPEVEAWSILDQALDAGINLIDTADAYKGGKSEQIIGRYLSARHRRSQVVLATKVGSAKTVRPEQRAGSRVHILEACEASLRRLGTDYIDLYQLHRPDFDTPFAETLDALGDLVKQGKIRYAGTSTFPAWLIVEGLKTDLGSPAEWLISEQPPYNLIDRRAENELVPMALRFGIALIPWSPTAGGILSGQYCATSLSPNARLNRQGGQSRFGQRVTRPAVAAAARVVELASSLGLTATQLALLWCKEQPGVTAPIFGPRTVPHLQDALQILYSRLDPEVGAELDLVNGPGNAQGDFHNSASWMKSTLNFEPYTAAFPAGSDM